MTASKAYLHFVEVVTGTKTQGWEVANNLHECLGHVFYQAHWRKYVFTPSTGKRMIFDDGCLQEITVFIREETRKLKAT